MSTKSSKENRPVPVQDAAWAYYIPAPFEPRALPRLTALEQMYAYYPG